MWAFQAQIPLTDNRICNSSSHTKQLCRIDGVPLPKHSALLLETQWSCTWVGCLPPISHTIQKKCVLGAHRWEVLRYCLCGFFVLSFFPRGVVTSSGGVVAWLWKTGNDQWEGDYKNGCCQWPKALGCLVSTKWKNLDEIQHGNSKRHHTALCSNSNTVSRKGITQGEWTKEPVDTQKHMEEIPDPRIGGEEFLA
jgi:hypothetical protein